MTAHCFAFVRRAKRAAAAAAAGEAGLTLVELVVVAVLLAVMSAILYGTINGMLGSRKRIEEKRWISRTARYALSQIRDDLRARVAEPVIGGDDDRQQRGNPYQSTYMLGKHQASGSHSSDSLTFVTQNVLGSSSSEAVLSGRNEVNYFLSREKVPGAALSGDQDAGLTLVRSSVPSGTKDKNLRKERMASFAVARNIQGLRFRYFRDAKWSEQWLAGQGRLPDAVEVELDVGQSAEDFERYKMLIVIADEVRSRRASGAFAGFE